MTLFNLITSLAVDSSQTPLVVQVTRPMAMLVLSPTLRACNASSARIMCQYSSQTPLVVQVYSAYQLRVTFPCVISALLGSGAKGPETRRLASLTTSFNVPFMGKRTNSKARRATIAESDEEGFVDAVARKLIDDDEVRDVNVAFDGKTPGSSKRDVVDTPDVKVEKMISFGTVDQFFEVGDTIMTEEEVKKLGLGNRLRPAYVVDEHDKIQSNQKQFRPKAAGVAMDRCGGQPLQFHLDEGGDSNKRIRNLIEQRLRGFHVIDFNSREFIDKSPMEKAEAVATMVAEFLHGFAPFGDMHLIIQVLTQNWPLLRRIMKHPSRGRGVAVLEVTNDEKLKAMWASIQAGTLLRDVQLTNDADSQKQTSGQLAETIRLKAIKNVGSLAAATSNGGYRETLQALGDTLKNVGCTFSHKSGGLFIHGIPIQEAEVVMDENGKSGKLVFSYDCDVAVVRDGKHMKTHVTGRASLDEVYFSGTDMGYAMDEAFRQIRALNGQQHEPYVRYVPEDDPYQTDRCLAMIFAQTMQEVNAAWSKIINETGSFLVAILDGLPKMAGIQIIHDTNTSGTMEMNWHS